MSGEALQVLNPADERVIGTVAVSSPADVAKAAETGAAAYRSWRAVPAHRRAAILQDFAALLAKRAPELGRLNALETGKPWRAAAKEVRDAGTKFIAYSNEALRLYGTTIPGDRQAGYEHDIVFTRREPIGLAAVITPFNFPISLFTHKVAPALATGNTVIVKPSEFTPLTTIAVVALLHEAGVPREVCQVVIGGSSVGQHLVGDPLVRLVSATGSTATGTAIAATAARHLSRLKLELGGNDPLIVLDDADVELAAAQAVAGRVPDNGQACAASKRFLVHESVADEFTERLVALLAGVRVGDQMRDDTDIGPLIHRQAAEQAAGQVAQALADGGRLALGSGRNDGTYLGPQVISEVDPGSAVAGDQEIFAPVFPVIRFRTTAQAVAIANQSVYGLSSSVFSADTGRALRVAYELEAGTVAINASGLYKPDALAFGGVKMSGLGREGLQATAEEFTQVKSIALRGALRPDPAEDAAGRA